MRSVKIQAFGQVVEVGFPSAICIIIIVGSFVVLPSIDYLPMLVISRCNMFNKVAYGLGIYMNGVGGSYLYLKVYGFVVDCRSRSFS